MATQRHGLLSADGWREPANRYDHSTAVVEEEVYLWAGEQPGLPRVHDSAEELAFLSSVEVFKVNTGCWEQRTTRGTPPLGVAGYSCVAVRNDLYYFGGESDRFHNSVHTLSTSTLQWRMLAPTTSEDGAPMKKSGCGVVHFTDEEEDLLFVVGGYGPTPSSYQHGAQYEDSYYNNCVCTNEQHIFCLSTSEWSSLKVTGKVPPPCSNFTLTKVGEKRAAMYGGWLEGGTFDDLFIVELGRHSVHWSNICTSIGFSVEWPQGRSHHAATHLFGPLFVIIGGLDKYGCILYDMWLCDTTTKLWKKLPLPDEYVARRYGHSISALQLGPHCIWLILFGGWSVMTVKAKTVIIELIQGGDGDWSVGDVVKRDTLSSNTVYLRERWRTIAELEQKIQHLQEKVQQLQEDKRLTHQHQMETEETLQQVMRQLTYEQEAANRRTREIEEENRGYLHQQEKIKDVPVSGSEGVEMEERKAGSGGGEDPSSLELTTADVIHAYDENLRASKEKEQQLQSQLATVQQESQDKEKQQLSKLEDENYDLPKEMVIVKYVNEQQQEELKRLQQKANEDEVTAIKDEQQRLLQVVEQQQEELTQKAGEDEAKLTASKEEQQQLLQQYQRIGRARDVQISQLQNENVLVQDKYDTLKARYLKLKAASDEKQSVDTVDTGVQADYLAVAPGFLRGVEVYGETVLEVVGDKPQKLEWPGYGFYMEVPEGALASGVTASVGVKVILSGQFKLPDNRQLISAIYWISSSEVFLKEVAVNIQHFAVIMSEEQCAKFSFMIAKCSQEELPYTFREKEGSFNPHTQYGAIKLKHFSLLGVISPEDAELCFTSLKFYKPLFSTLTMVDYIFVVVYNHELFLEFIRKEYHGYSEDKQNQLLVFEDNVMVLDLPADDPLDKGVNGWKILPLTHPQIAKDDIKKFKGGRTLPACTIQVEWIGSGEPKNLCHKVNIIGAQKPNNYFYMRYSPQEYKPIADSSSKEAAALEEIATGGQTRGVGESDQQTLSTYATPTLLELKTMEKTDGTPLNIIERVAAGDYTTFGMFLLQDVNGDEVERIKRDHRQDGTESITQAIIRQWLTSGGPTCTYEHLIKCLNQSRLSTLAKLIADNR